jgi:hypothetical protein
VLRSRLLRSIARLWWLRTYVGSAHAPLPRDTPSVRSGAADADRVLVVGNGAASGWGMLTHGLALPGRLAAHLQHATGRPCDVDLLGDDVMNAGSAPDWIGDRPIAAYDAVVVVLGFSDAVRQTSDLRWRAELERLLHVLQKRTRHSAAVVVSGIEPIASAPVFGGLLGSLAQRNADRLNAVTRALVADRPGVEFAELTSATTVPDRHEQTRAGYDHWATQLAAVVSPLLERSRTSPDRPAGANAEPLAPARPSGDLSALRSLVEDAKSEFGVDLAWVGLHHGDRQVIAVSTEDRSPASVPMDLTFCRYTEAADDTFVVPDAPADARFAGNPFFDVLHLEAYAGHPLHDGNGAVIGTFCLATIRPRAGMATVSDRLERYARDAEAALQGARADTEREPQP